MSSGGRVDLGVGGYSQRLGKSLLRGAAEPTHWAAAGVP